MPNKSGNAYGLTTLCPLKATGAGNTHPVLYTRSVLQDLPTYTTSASRSPMSKVPDTYLARFFILDETLFQAYPNFSDQLKSKYLVFTTNFYGDLDTYLNEMYRAIPDDIHQIWRDCIGFNHVKDAQSFSTYIKRCQVQTTFYFNGSTDESLAEQLKSLYIKQEFSKFVFKNQGVRGAALLDAYKNFVATADPSNLSAPTWTPGAP